MRLVDADLLDEEVMYWFMCMTGNPKPTTVVNECKSSFRNMIDEQPTVDAVPVEEIKLHIAKLKDNMEKYGSNQIDLGRMLALTELIERKESVNND